MLKGVARALKQKRKHIHQVQIYPYEYYSSWGQYTPDLIGATPHLVFCCLSPPPPING